MLMSHLREFRWSFLVTFICLAVAGYWGQRWEQGPLAALWVCIVLGVMEVTLSFDNAVVNAAVLREMDERWRRLFLTVGIIVAVFGMRLVFPLVIVVVTTGLGWVEVGQMALNDPDEYSRHLTENHTSIAAFGGMFLLLVFLAFLFDNERKLHWLGAPERRFARLGKLEAIGIVTALGVLYATQRYLPLTEAQRLTVMTAGVFGIVLYVMVDSMGALFEHEEDGDAAVAVVKRSGAASFVYLEILDASFSFDGVIGAFAITRDVVIIMLGLAIGAMFVRSLTVYLVNRGTLEQYVFLEHGAMYAIGALAVIMLVSIAHHIPESVTGTIGIVFIIAALISSVRYRRRHAAHEGHEAG